MPLAYKRNEVKERVRATWKGACNVTLPSFTLRFDALNEKAITPDVRRGADSSSRAVAAPGSARQMALAVKVASGLASCNLSSVQIGSSAMTSLCAST